MPNLKQNRAQNWSRKALELNNQGKFEKALDATIKQLILTQTMHEYGTVEA